jgi:cytochrome c peroxidase
VQVADLPPIPVTARSDPGDLTPALDEHGAPIIGPSLGVQGVSTDPGRAALLGDPLDFEAFDVPQLRGIARTAPYFHVNPAGTLRAVVDLPAARSAPQKRDLIAFLPRR